MASNTQHTMTLTDFLLARIAEDERRAEGIHDIERCGALEWGGNTFNECDCGWPANVLAECEAKLRIVERCSAVDYAMPSTHLAHGILGLLALPYADHPDYREEWRA